MRALWAIAVKDVRLLTRDRAGFFFTFVFPLIIAVFFGKIFAAGPAQGPIELSVLDLDQTPGSAAFVESLGTSGDFAISVLPTLGTASKQDAIDQVRRGQISACLILQPGLGAARETPFSGVGGGGGMVVELAIDPARKGTAGMLEGLLTKQGFASLADGFKDPEKMRAQARSSLAVARLAANLSPQRKAELEKFYSSLDTMIQNIPKDASASSGADDKASPGTVPSDSSSSNPLPGFSPLTIKPLPVLPENSGPKNPYQITFPQGIIWGIMGCTLGFAISLVMERTRGTLIRLRCAPLTAFHILGGKGLACFMVTLAASITLMLIGVLGFGLRPTSPLKLGLALIAVSVCFVGIMMLLATFSTSERGGNGLGWGVLLMFSMIGGGMIPLEFLPPWLLPISHASPIKWAILAIEGGLWRDLPWGQMLLPLGVLLGVGAGGFGVGMAVLGDAERS